MTENFSAHSETPDSSLDWMDLLLAHPELTSQFILEVSDGMWECRCGNSTESEGFIACDEEGLEVAEELGPWDGILRACQRCWRVINSDTLEVLGFASASVVATNDEYRWGDSTA